MWQSVCTANDLMCQRASLVTFLPPSTLPFCLRRLLLTVGFPD